MAVKVLYEGISEAWYSYPKLCKAVCGVGLRAPQCEVDQSRPSDVASRGEGGLVGAGQYPHVLYSAC